MNKKIRLDFILYNPCSNIQFILLLTCFPLMGDFSGILGKEESQAPEVSYEPGPYLMLDRQLIADQANIRRIIHSPERLPQPVVTAKEDKNFQPYISVIRDAEAGLFRMWYNTPESISQSHLAHITSQDGIHWERPHEELADPSFIQFGASILDEGPDFSKPDHRYKFGFWARNENGIGGLKVAISSNGLEWSMLRPGVLLPHNHDINSLHWDSIRRHYIAFGSVKIFEGPTWSGSRRRIPHQSVSKDLIHWEDPWPVVMPEKGEQGETQFYCMSGLLRRGHLLVTLVKVLRDDINAEPNTTALQMGDENRKAAGIGYTVLAWSRDGRTWDRDIEPFFDRNPKSGTWDRAHAWMDCQVPVGDEVYIYYGGYARGHKVERFKERQVGLARMKRDRYVSMEADGGEGRLTTETRVLAADSISVNADIFGLRDSLRVRVVDIEGVPFNGFDFTDCKPIEGDSLRHDVVWANELNTLEGERVRFEFAWTNGSLFSFDLYR